MARFFFLCSSSAAYLAKLNPQTAAPSLTLSTDASPNITLRNLGTLAATNLRVKKAGDFVNLEFDLLAKYKWDRYEFLFSISNIANKKWRSAQFFHESQLQTEPAPVNDIHFTPGEPLTIKAGMTVHLW